MHMVGLCIFLWVSISVQYAAPSAAPGGLMQTIIGSNYLVIVWRDVSYILLNGLLTGYNIQYGVEGSGKMTTVFQPGSSKIRNISGLQSATTYAVRVGVVSTGGNSSLSSAIRAATLQDSKS